MKGTVKHMSHEGQRLMSPTLTSLTTTSLHSGTFHTCSVDSDFFINILFLRSVLGFGISKGLQERNSRKKIRNYCTNGLLRVLYILP